MGYTTDFVGQFDLDKPLKPEHAAYLTRFSETRRMKRNPVVASDMPDPIRTAAGLPIGEEGGYYLSPSDFGQGKDASIEAYNNPPEGQPGLWCQWVPNDARTAMVWNDGEKFYHYVEWLEYLIENFLKPWGYNVNGIVHWTGEDRSDKGTIFVQNNVVSSGKGHQKKATKSADGMSLAKFLDFDFRKKFREHYMELHEEDPEENPVNMTPAEWLQAFGEWIQDGADMG